MTLETEPVSPGEALSGKLSGKLHIPVLSCGPNWVVDEPFMFTIGNHIIALLFL